MTANPYIERGRRVMRRCVYALNTLALRDDRVPRDGAFDAAAANGLAAIVAHTARGTEYYNHHRRVKSPAALLAIIEQDATIRTDAIDSSDLSVLKEAVQKAQTLRHGRADDDWDVLGQKHVDALVALDRHPALQVLALLDGMNFAEAAVQLHSLEAEEAGSEPDICDACGRMTLIAAEADAFGFSPGEGTCIACGVERTYEDTLRDYLEWKFGEPG